MTRPRSGAQPTEARRAGWIASGGADGNAAAKRHHQHLGLHGDADTGTSALAQIGLLSSSRSALLQRQPRGAGCFASPRSLHHAGRRRSPQRRSSALCQRRRSPPGQRTAVDVSRRQINALPLNRSRPFRRRSAGSPHHIAELPAPRGSAPSPPPAGGRPRRRSDRNLSQRSKRGVGASRRRPARPCAGAFLANFRQHKSPELRARGQIPPEAGGILMSPTAFRDGSAKVTTGSLGLNETHRRGPAAHNSGQHDLAASSSGMDRHERRPIIAVHRHFNCSTRYSRSDHTGLASCAPLASAIRISPRRTSIWAARLSAKGDAAAAVEQWKTGVERLSAITGDIIEYEMHC